jgi:RNA polymerase sigma-70 factor, ECF subfamily
MALGPTFESTIGAGKAGADWALTALYRDLQPALLAYLKAQEPNEGEDLCSDVWLEIGRGLVRFDGDESAFRCWAFTIARRRLIDLRRRRARRRTQPVPLEALDRPDQADAFHSVETGEALLWLARLPAVQAEVVLLRVVAGLDSKEVARIMGKKPGTIRVIQKRALERLAELVAAQEESVTQ